MARKKTDPDEQLEQEIGNAFVDAGIMAPTEDMPGTDSVVAEASQDAADAKPEAKDDESSEDLQKRFDKLAKRQRRIEKANRTVIDLNAEVAESVGMIAQQLTPLFAVVLDIELTNGNDGRNKRWFKPAKIRKQMEELLRAKRLVPSRPFPKPVVLKITRLLGKGQRLWDFDSCGRGNSKELIDSMVACGWFVDDSPKWIEGCFFDQRKDDREKPAVLVEVFTPASPTGE